MDKPFLDRFLKLTPLICAFMVVGIHCYTLPDKLAKTATGLIEATFAHGLCTAAVPLFMMISGYLFYRNVTEMKDVFAKQKKRAFSYLLPFLVWSLIYYVIYIFLYRFGISTVKSDTSPLGIIKGVIFYKRVFPLWFLFQLIVYTVISPLIFIALKNKKVTLALFSVVAVLGIIGISFKIKIDSTSRTIFSPNFFAYYFAGVIASQNKEKFLKAEEKLRKINTPLCFAMMILFGAAEGIIYNLNVTFNKRMLVPAVVFFTFIMLDKLSFPAKNIKADISAVSTMAIYVVHPLVATLLHKALTLLPIPALAEYALLFLGTVTVSCIVSVIIKKIKPLNFVLCGNR